MDFLRNGRFGPLTLGSLGQEVRAFLGDPEAISVQEYPRILKYGQFQIALDENRVVSLAIHTRDQDRAWKGVVVEGLQLSRATSLKEFLSILEKNNITARTSAQVDYEDFVRIDLSSGVSAFFDRKGDESWLRSLDLFDKAYGAARAAERVREVQGVKNSLEKSNMVDAPGRTQHSEGQGLAQPGT
jgi:hypothetical protein